VADAGHAGNDAVLNREVFFVVIGGLAQFAFGVDVSVVEAFVFGHLNDLLRAIGQRCRFEGLADDDDEGLVGMTGG
jgi:hypothetical protein